MTAFQRIVFATDLSEASVAALGCAQRLAAWHGAELHLLHISIDVDPLFFFHEVANGPEDPTQAHTGHARATLQELARQCPTAVKTAVERSKKAAPAIADYADRVSADLIIVGSHGYSGIDRLMLGSQARHLLKLATVPVLIVGAATQPGAEGKAPFTRLLAPVDLSPQSLAAIRRAAGLAQDYGATLTALHAIDLVVPGYYPPASPNTQVPLAKQALARFLDDAGLADRPREVVIAAPAAPSIQGEAQREGVDLIVLSRSGLGRIQRFLIGSVTERVIDLAPCAVLVLPGNPEP